MMLRTNGHRPLSLLMALFMGTLFVFAADVPRQQQLRSETLHAHRIQAVRHLPSEIRDLRTTPLMTSPLPVSIRQQGRQLCVISRYNQLLPVYSANGTYYSAFRIAKGTNWLTGLPRGGYIINNKRYVIH